VPDKTISTTQFARFIRHCVDEELFLVAVESEVLLVIGPSNVEVLLVELRGLCRSQVSQIHFKGFCPASALPNGG
jgi:hypothetical protein